MRHKLIGILLLVAACGGGGGDEGPDPLGTTFALDTVEEASGLTSQETRDLFDATLVDAPVGVLVQNSNPTLPLKIPLEWLEISHYGIMRVTLDQGQVDTLFGNPQLTQTFPEGEGDIGYTILPTTPLEAPAGDFFIAHFSTIGFIPVPLSADPTVLYQYAFTFDKDGNDANNFTTDDRNFFNDTDLWYVADYANATGWTLTIFDATDGVVQEIGSAARMVFRGNSLTLIVPTTEFDVANPSYRVSSFCHTGDFGQAPPYTWSGDIHPRVVDGLEGFPE